MRAVDLAVRVVDRVRAIGVCLFCDVYDHGSAHASTCPVGEYERTALVRGRRFIETDREGRDSVRPKGGES